MPYDPYPKTTTAQNVISGLNAFADSVNHLAMQTSLQQAQQQIDDATANSKNDFEKHQAYAAAGQRLAFGMAAAGADASQIGAVRNAIPGTPAPVQNTLEGATSENPDIQAETAAYMTRQEAAKAAVAEVNAKSKADVAGIQAAAKITAGQAAAGRAEQAKFSALGYNLPKDLAKLQDGQVAAARVSALANIGDVSNAATELRKIGNLQQMGLGRITHLEIKGQDGNMSLGDRFERALNITTEGVPPAKDLENLKLVGDTIAKAGRDSLESGIDSAATAMAISGTGKYQMEDYRKVMRARAGFDKAPTAQYSGASAPAAPAPAASGAFGIPGATLIGQ